MVDEKKKGINVLKERMGGMKEDLKNWIKEQNQIQKGIKEALKGKEMTIPELSKALNMPSERVIWTLMAMRKYGLVVEVGQEGDYFLYTLAEKQ